MVLLLIFGTVLVLFFLFDEEKYSPERRVEIIRIRRRRGLRILRFQRNMKQFARDGFRKRKRKEKRQVI